jgi:hypothetical protein
LNNKDKYYKYKTKYLLLKTQLGGKKKELNINLTSLLPLFKKLISDYNMEFNFNFILDNDNLFLEIKKGVSDMTVDKILDPFKYSYVTGHTHFASGSKDWEYSPPSSKDFSLILETFYRYYTKMHIIFSDKGIWKVKINDKLNFFNTTNPDLKIQLKLFDFYRCNMQGYQSTKAWTDLLHDIEDKTNDLHIRLAQPKELKDRLVLYPKISLEDYMNEIKKIGFDIEFINWDDIKGNFEVNIKIADTKYEFINYFAYFKNHFIPEEKPFLIKVTDVTHDIIIDKIKETEEGENVYFY